MSDLMGHIERLPHSNVGNVSPQLSSFATTVSGVAHGAEVRACIGGSTSPPARSATVAQRSEEAQQQHFSLVFCPEFPPGTVYRLVRLDERGASTLYEGVALSEAPSLNLAKVRHRGARLGANRVVLVPPSASIRFVSLEP